MVHVSFPCDICRVRYGECGGMKGVNNTFPILIHTTNENSSFDGVL